MNFDEKEKTGNIRVLCSKGTYIRSICDDLGSCLGCGAIMTNLKRTMACGFKIEESVTISEAKELNEVSRLNERVIGIDKIFRIYKYINVSEAQAKRFRNGGSLDLLRTNVKNNYSDKEKFRVYHKGEFLGLGIASREMAQLLIYKLF